MTVRSARRGRAIAYHEAGHALAMWRNDLRFKSVTVEATDAYLGRVIREAMRLTDTQLYNKTPVTRHRLERHIVAMLAGPEAQRLVAGRYDHSDASDDRSQALELVERIVGGAGNEVRPYFRWLEVRARNLVEDPRLRKPLDALAEALLVRGTLLGKEAVYVMQIAISPRLADGYAPWTDPDKA